MVLVTGLGGRRLAAEPARERPGDDVGDRDEHRADDERGAGIGHAEEQPLEDGVAQDAREEEHGDALPGLPDDGGPVRAKEDPVEKRRSPGARVHAARLPPEEDRHRRLEEEPELSRSREALREVLEEPDREEIEAPVFVRLAERARHRDREHGERQHAEDQANARALHSRSPPSSPGSSYAGRPRP